MSHLELDGERMTVADPGQTPLGSVPEASRALHPGALVKRNWLLITTIALVVAVHLVVLTNLIPKSAAATSRVRVTGANTGSLFDTSVELSPEEERESLIVDLESPAVLARAAASAGVPAATVEVVATSPRETLFVDVAVTAEDGEAAVEIANAIPGIVAETRRERTRETAEALRQELRTQAEEAIAEAEALEAQVAELGSDDDPSTSFRAEQQRNALVSQYATLIGQAFDVERRAASPSVGFEVSSPATGVDRSLPPGRDQTIPLALLAGLIVGVGAVAVRDLTGGRLYREHFEAGADASHLGLLRWTRGRLREDDVHAVTARLRALPAMRQPTPMLIAVVTLETGSAFGRVTACQLTTALAESGLETAVLAADFADDTDRQTKGGHQQDGVRVSLDTTALGTDVMFHLRRSGGSPLAAAYATDTKESIDLICARHQVVLLDPMRAGVDVESWLTAVVRPDLALVVIAEGVSTRDEAAAAMSRLSQAGLDAASTMVARRSWPTNSVLQSWRRRRATEARPAPEHQVVLARGPGSR